MALDIEKAFNLDAWPYMSSALEVMGCRVEFCRWIDILYRVKLGGTFLHPFPIGRGTRQGCPLSLALFALVMKPLVSALRCADMVRCIQVGSINEKLAMYADDLILFLNDPGPSLQAALGILSGFTACSGLKVNLDKSQILPIDTVAQPLSDPNLPLILANKIKYLGIYISSSTDDYYTVH